MGTEPIITTSAHDLSNNQQVATFLLILTKQSECANIWQVTIFMEYWFRIVYHHYWDMFHKHNRWSYSSAIAVSLPKLSERCTSKELNCSIRIAFRISRKSFSSYCRRIDFAIIIFSKIRQLNMKLEDWHSWMLKTGRF